MSQDPAHDLERALERLAGWIPGYGGYRRKERLREEDRALRNAVVARLGLLVGRIERALSHCIRTLPPRDIEAADKFLRLIGRDRDRIRFAPEGLGSLFAREKVQDKELQGILEHDASLGLVLDDLDVETSAWEGISENDDARWPEKPMRTLGARLAAVLEEREALLRS